MPNPPASSLPDDNEEIDVTALYERIEKLEKENTEIKKEIAELGESIDALVEKIRG